MMFKIAFTFGIFAVYCGFLGQRYELNRAIEETSCIVQENDFVKSGNHFMLFSETGKVLTTSDRTSEHSSSDTHSSFLKLESHLSFLQFVFQYKQYLVQWTNALVLDQHLNIIFPFHSFW